jgi:hypothetical protein
MDWVRVLDEHSGSVIALATVAYLAVTLLLWIESRASRVAATEAARVVVRYGLAQHGRITDTAELLNFGPALATDVGLNLAFLNRAGAVATQRSLHFPALAPGDLVTILPGLMLPREKKVMAPTASEMAETGYRLRVTWSWCDNRRGLARRWRPRHRDSLEIDLKAYSDSVAEGLIVLQSTVESVLEAIREDRRRERFEDSAHRSLDDMSGLPAEVRARIEGDRARATIELWMVRLRYVLRTGRSSLVRLLGRWVGRPNQRP